MFITYTCSINLGIIYAFRKMNIFFKERILNCFMYLQKCVLFFVLQDSLQKILEQLSLRLFTDHRLHEKRRVLLMYRLICRRMLRDLEGGLGGGFVFILREIIHRLVYLLQEMKEQEGYLYINLYQYINSTACLYVFKNCNHCNFLFVCFLE